MIKALCYGLGFFCYTILRIMFFQSNPIKEKPEESQFNRDRKILLNRHLVLRSSNGAMVVLGFNIFVLLELLSIMFPFEPSWMVVFLISGGISLIITGLILDQGNYYHEVFIPEQLKLSFEKRVMNNLYTFIIFFSLPIGWFGYQLLTLKG